MKFTKQLRFNEPYYFSGMYKIVKYTNNIKPHYHAYLHNGTAWGDYVNRKKQFNEKLSLQECKNLCVEHEKSTGKADKYQLKRADQSRLAWLKEI